MEIRLLLSHNGTVYDVSNVVVDGIRLTHSIRMEAGSLRFSVVRDGVMQFVEGDPLQLYVDGMLRFSGWVMTKERTSAQIITVTAYDMLFYLAKNSHRSGKNDCRKRRAAGWSDDRYQMENTAAH